RSLPDHVGGDRAAHEVHAADVDRHHPVEELRAGLLDRAHAADPGVVEQHVDPPEPLGGPPGESFGLGLVRDVDGVRGGDRARRLYLPGRGLSRGRVDVGHHDGRALAGEDEGAGPADPRAGPGDEADLSLEPHQESLVWWALTVRSGYLVT